MALTQTQKNEIMNFRNEITACDKFIEQGTRELKNGKILEASHTAMRILGAANRIQKAGTELAKNEIPYKQEKLANLLSARQSDIGHLADALKGGSEFLSFAENYAGWILKTDSQILVLCDDGPPERKDPADTGAPDFYPADPK